MVGLGVTLLLASACSGDDADEPIELTTACRDFLEHADAERAEALATLGAANGWDGGADEGALDDFDAVCEYDSDAAVGDLIEAAAQGDLNTTTAAVEEFCSQVETFVAAVEEAAQDLDDLDSSGLQEEGTALVNDAGELPPVRDDVEQDRVEACTRQAADAVLALNPA